MGTGRILDVVGDLDKKLKEISKEYYNNWDGHVGAAEGKAWVAAEFAFHDGSPPGTHLRRLREKAHRLKRGFREKAQAKANPRAKHRRADQAQAPAD